MTTTLQTKAPRSSSAAAVGAATIPSAVTPKTFMRQRAHPGQAQPDQDLAHARRR